MAHMNTAYITPGRLSMVQNSAAQHSTAQHSLSQGVHGLKGPPPHWYLQRLFHLAEVWGGYRGLGRGEMILSDPPTCGDLDEAGEAQVAVLVVMLHVKAKHICLQSQAPVGA